MIDIRDDERDMGNIMQVIERDVKLILLVSASTSDVTPTIADIPRGGQTFRRVAVRHGH